MDKQPLHQMQYEAVQLSVLLKTLHSALPDDLTGCDIDTRFIVGWAYQMADQLADGIDALDLTITGGRHA